MVGVHGLSSGVRQPKRSVLCCGREVGKHPNHKLCQPRLICGAPYYKTPTRPPWRYNPALCCSSGAALHTSANTHNAPSRSQSSSISSFAKTSKSCKLKRATRTDSSSPGGTNPSGCGASAGGGRGATTWSGLSPEERFPRTLRGGAECSSSSESRNKAGSNMERLHKAVANTIAAQHDVAIVHRW